MLHPCAAPEMIQTDLPARSAKRFERTDWLIVSLLVGITAALFCQTVRFDFVHYDDPEYVFLNDYVKHGLNWKNVEIAFTSTTLGNWHPLTWLSYMIDAQLFGINPAAFHRTNVILHTC